MCLVDDRRRWRAAVLVVLLLGTIALSYYASSSPLLAVTPPPPLFPTSSAIGSNSLPSLAPTASQACLPQLSSNLSLFLNSHHTTPRYFYALPSSTQQLPVALSSSTLEHETRFVFIHINKAGGTLFKYKILHAAAKRYGWSGAGFGSMFGWQRLSQGCTSASLALKYPKHTELESFACGKQAELTACGPRGGDACPLRVIWGSQSLPLCAGGGGKSSCVMSVVLRHPVDRLISQYNYVCIEGSEGRKKWDAEWKRAGRCPLTLLEFLDRTGDLTSETFLIDHLAMSSSMPKMTDDACSSSRSKVALQNLHHPCVRYLLLDRLQDGLSRLAKVWGPAMRPLLQQLAKSNATLNSAQYKSPRLQAQLANSNIIAQVTKRLHLDVAFYNTAVQTYEDQWASRLVSCV